MKKLTENELEFIINRALSNAKEAFESEDSSEFASGRRLAYYELLDTIKNELGIREIDVSRFGLDIKLEKLLK